MTSAILAACAHYTTQESMIDTEVHRLPGVDTSINQLTRF
jgi:hypothetical protein